MNFISVLKSFAQTLLKLLISLSKNQSGYMSPITPLAPPPAASLQLAKPHPMISSTGQAFFPLRTLNLLCWDLPWVYRPASFKPVLHVHKVKPGHQVYNCKPFPALSAPGPSYSALFSLDISLLFYSNNQLLMFTVFPPQEYISSTVIPL